MLASIIRFVVIVNAIFNVVAVLSLNQFGDGLGACSAGVVACSKAC